MDLLFSRRRVPFCRKRLFRTEKRATVPCVRCLALWARDAAGVRGRRCLPCGQRRCRVARRILACRGKSRVSVRFTHQEIFPARRGGGKRASPRKERSFSRTPSALRSPNEPFPTRNGDTPHLTDETRSFPLQNLPHLSICGKRGLLQGTSPRHRFSRRTSGARPSPAFHPLQNPSFPPFPPPPHPPTIPPGERRALPAPAQGSRPLRIPFVEPAPVFPVSPSPKRRRRTAPARGPSAVYALCRRIRNETQRASPLLMGLGCVNTPPKALAGGTAAPKALPARRRGRCR